MSALPEPCERARQKSAPRAEPEHLPRWEYAVLAALLALCLLARVVNLMALPVFFDEAEYTRAVQILGAIPGPATWLLSLHYGAPPLFTWLAAPLARLIADPLLAARLASALVGVAGMLGVWATARLLWGAVAAPLAALLYALCPFLVLYNRMVMLDGLVAACGAGALFFALRLSRQGRGIDGLALGLCLGAGLLTKVFALSMLLLPLLAVLAAWPEQRRAARRGATIAAVLGILPFLALLLTPQGVGLLSASHAHAHITEHLAAILGQQLATWGAALWLYLTPPVLGLALLGLWAMRRERAALLLGPWALLGGLPPALVPAAFLAPRYFLYIAVPTTILAARGLLALAGAVQRRVAPRWAVWTLALATLLLVSLPALSADAAIIGAPRAAPLTAFDRWQYVTGWPSGYAFVDALAYLRRQETRGSITIYSSIYNPPGDALALALGRDPRVTLANVDFDTLRAHPLHAARGQRAYLIACRPYGQRLHPNLRLLRLVWQAPNGDHIGGDDVYEVLAP